MQNKISGFGFTLFLLLFTLPSFSQYNRELLQVNKSMRTANPDMLYKRLIALKKESFSAADSALYYKTLSAYYYEKNIEDDKGYKALLEAKALYKKIDSTDAEMDINRQIFNFLFYSEASTIDPLPYAEAYLEYALKKNNDEPLARAYAIMGDYNSYEGDAKVSIDYFRKALKHVKRTDKDELRMTIHTNMSVVFSEKLNQPDSALYYLRQDVPIYQKKGDMYGLSGNYSNQGSAYYYKGDTKKAIDLFLEAMKILPENAKSWQYKRVYSQSLIRLYEEYGKYREALEYSRMATNYADSLETQKRKIAIKDIEGRYKAKEKELENTVLRNNIKTNRILLYTLSTIALLIIGLSILIVRNSKRKEKIANQQKIIEQQKLEKALKEHELDSIEKMFEGQELERARIAADLHDNLGSMLATLKLNFENLKLRKTSNNDIDDKLYNNSEVLIDEAYQKVRRIAHTKNAGVPANEGLVKAVQKLAGKVNIPGKLEIQVITDVTEKLDNKLELTTFRMIQELITNIVKHSKATEATINITTHTDLLNIIIEDNGVGFNTKDIVNDGMGLNGISNKAAQLNGTFEIDATPGRGSTFIIELPL